MNQEAKKGGGSLWLILVLIIGGALGAFFFLNKTTETTSTVKPLPKAASVKDIKWETLYSSIIDKITASLKKNVDLITTSKGVQSVVKFVVGLNVPKQVRGELSFDVNSKTSFKALSTQAQGKINLKGSTLQEPVLNFDGSIDGALISTSKELFLRLNDVKFNIEGKDIQPMQTAMAQALLSGFLSQYGNKWIKIDLSGADYVSNSNIDPATFVKFIYGFFNELKSKPILVVESENLLDNKKEFILSLSSENINSLIDYVVNDPVGKQIIYSSGQPIKDEDIKQLKETIRQAIDKANWRGKAIVDVNYNYEILLPLYSWSGSGDITGTVLKIYPDKLELVVNEAEAKGNIVWEVKNGQNLIKGLVKGKDANGKDTDLLNIEGNIDYKVKNKDVITKGYVKIKFVSPTKESISLEFKLDEKDTYTDKEIKVEIPKDFVNLEEILGGLGGFNMAPVPGMGPTEYQINPDLPRNGGEEEMMPIEIMPSDNMEGGTNGEGITPEQLQQLQEQFAQ